MRGNFKLNQIRLVMYVIEWFYWRALVHGTCETWESGIIFCYSSKIKFNHIILKQNPCN